MIDPETIFKLSQDSFEKFYEGHDTRESIIVIEAIRNFHTIFQEYLYRSEQIEKQRKESKP